MGLQQVVESEVVIDRPIADVYDFYVDFKNLPKFLGDVAAVRETGSRRWRWTVLGPLGLRLAMTVQVDEDVRQKVLSYRTVGPVGARWTLRFASLSANRTRVREELRGAFGPPVSFAMALIGKHPQGEVDSNLQRLKELLEDGRVSTTTHAVRGKFDK